jgi:heme exporter protein B|tara:strand:+ start:4554 stop:5228 length:675 start_codon:yes stop_codon:yes gene_type:complete
MTNTGFVAIFRRDLLLAVRHRGDLSNPIIFFFIIIALVPLGLTPESSRLSEIAPGMLWITALLASLLSLNSMFQDDYNDGALEQIMILPQPLYFIVLAKIIVHWLVTGLPLSLLAPVFGMMLSLPEYGYLPLMLSLLIGTATLSLLGAIGSALTLPLDKEGFLLPLIVMPFYMPILIFGSSTVQFAIDGLSILSPLAVMGSLFALFLFVAPYVAAGALRLSVQG